MYFDLHVHSEYSYDSFNKIEDILKVAKQRRLSGVAITDHEEFAGSMEALKQAKYWDLLVIPGMEIATEVGDIIGLFLKQKITTTIFNDVVSEIKKQGGLVVLPHPFKRTNYVSKVVLSKIDFIEVFNARGENLGMNRCNQRAYNLAIKSNIPMTAGSDAHFLREIGRGCVDIPPVSSLGELKEKLLTDCNKNIVMHPSSLYMEVFSQFIKGYKTKNMGILMSSFKKFVRTMQWDTYMKIKNRGRRDHV